MDYPPASGWWGRGWLDFGGAESHTRSPTRRRRGAPPNSSPARTNSKLKPLGADGKLAELSSTARACQPRRSTRAAMTRMAVAGLFLFALYSYGQKNARLSSELNAASVHQVQTPRPPPTAKADVLRGQPGEVVKQAPAAEVNVVEQVTEPPPPLTGHVQCPHGEPFDETKTLVITTGGNDHGRWWARNLPLCWVELNPTTSGWADCYSGHSDHCLLHFFANNYDVLPTAMIVTSKTETDWMDSVPKDLLFTALPKESDRPPYLPLPSAFVRPTSLTPKTYFAKAAIKEGVIRAWDEVLRGGIGKKLKPLFLDQSLYCCSQFVVSAAAVRRHPPRFYRDLSAAVSANIPRHNSYPLEMLWHQAFLEEPKMPDSTHIMVRNWRTNAINAGCSEWDCSCAGYIQMQNRIHDGKQPPPTIDPRRQQQWWTHGGYDTPAYFQLDVDSPYLVEFYSRWSPAGRDKGGYGTCEGNALSVVRQPQGAPQGPGENAEGQLEAVKAGNSVEVNEKKIPVDGLTKGIRSLAHKGQAW